MKKLSIGCICILLIPFCRCASAHESSVSGNVIDAAEQPVMGAIVRLRREPSGPTQQTITDSTGHFQINIHACGRFKISVQATAFEFLSEMIDVTNTGHEFELRLKPRFNRNDTVVVTADINDLDVISPDPAV